MSDDTIEFDREEFRNFGAMVRQVGEELIAEATERAQVFFEIADLMEAAE